MELKSFIGSPTLGGHLPSQVSSVKSDLCAVHAALCWFQMKLKGFVTGRPTFGGHLYTQVSPDKSGLCEVHAVFG